MCESSDPRRSFFRLTWILGTLLLCPVIHAEKVFQVTKSVFKSLFPLSCCEWVVVASTTITSHHHLALLCAQLQSARVCVKKTITCYFVKPIWIKRVTIHCVERPFFVLVNDADCCHLLAGRLDKVLICTVSLLSLIWMSDLSLPLWKRPLVKKTKHWWHSKTISWSCIFFGGEKKETQSCRATLTRSELVITTCLVYVCLWTSNPLALLCLQPFIPSLMVSHHSSSLTSLTEVNGSISSLWLYWSLIRISTWLTWYMRKYSHGWIVTTLRRLRG